MTLEMLSGTKLLFRGVRVVVIDSFFITCVNSPDKSIIHGISDKQMTDIHSTMRLLWCQFMRYGSTLLYYFPRILIWRCMLSFDPPSSSKTLRMLAIAHNLDHPECGKSLLFSSPVLKRWNHCCATCSLVTLSPSISSIL